MKLAGIVHALDDVRATHQFTADIQLRNRWPVAVVLDALAHGFIAQHVEGFVVVDDVIETANGGGGKAARGRLAIAFHEQHHALAGEQGFDAIANLWVE